jgi:hypothetical protein
MKRRNILYRYRLLTSLSALVLLLGAFAATPAGADGFVPEGWDVCYTGCVNWNQKDGCVECQACCSKNSTGEYQCWTDEPSHCA